jgi:hypothetical protein
MIDVSLGWKTQNTFKNQENRKKGMSDKILEVIKCEWPWQDAQKSEFLIKFMQVTHGNSCEYTRLHLELVNFSKL